MKNPNLNPGDMVRIVYGPGLKEDPLIFEGCIGTLVFFLGDVEPRSGHLIPDCWVVDWADGHKSYVAQYTLIKIQPGGGDSKKIDTFIPGSWDKCPWDPVNGDKTERRIEENVDG